LELKLYDHGSLQPLPKLGCDDPNSLRANIGHGRAGKLGLLDVAPGRERIAPVACKSAASPTAHKGVRLKILCSAPAIDGVRGLRQVPYCDAAKQSPVQRQRPRQRRPEARCRGTPDQVGATATKSPEEAN
jgi:hypothetical protein